MVQFTVALVKSHEPDVDLDPIGDGMGKNCTNAQWEAHLEAASG